MLFRIAWRLIRGETPREILTEVVNMATHDRLKSLHGHDHAGGKVSIRDVLELLDQAVFLDDLPPELVRDIQQRRRDRKTTAETVAKGWSRGYICSKHGTITAALCGDCAQEGVSPSANVRRK